MPKPRCRPFTIIDGMILVAAIALTFWLVRVSDEYNGPLFYWGELNGAHTLTDESDIPYLHVYTTFARKGGVPLLLPSSLGLLIIRLRSPRPVLRRLARQPGFAATSVVALVVSVDFVGRAVAYIPAFAVHAQLAFMPWTVGPPMSYRPIPYLKNVLSYLTQGIMWFLSWYQVSLWAIHSLLGAAVAGAWMVMGLGRTGRTEPGWIDRSGITLGLLWVITLLAYCLSYDWR